MLTIVVDENIPFGIEALGRYGEVRLLPGRSISRDDLRGVDALVVRSVTRVDRSLLEGTPVSFVGTATIGTDHIDLDYLRHAGIAFADAAGCNSLSVAEYVVAALLELRARGEAEIGKNPIGIVGLGRIGRVLAPMLRSLGAVIVEYDPPRQEREVGFVSAGPDELRACGIITFHVPLTGDGPWPTRRMVGRRFLADLGSGTILVNASRGGVVDSGDLIRTLQEKRVRAVLDVWAEEPDIPPELIERCLIATPHIAGYSFDGKLRGTEMMAEALGRFCSHDDPWRRHDVLPSEAGRIDIPAGLAPLDAAYAAIRTAYDIGRDDSDLRGAISGDPDERRRAFDALRKGYRVRREFPAWAVRCDDPETRYLLESLGFATA